MAFSVKSYHAQRTPPSFPTRRSSDLDVDPAIFGAETRHATVKTKDRRTRFELAVTRGALSADKPELGICGGQQLLKDRKSTRLNSSHMSISYAVFGLKKKNTTIRLSS